MKKGILFLNGVPPRENILRTAVAERAAGAIVYCTDGAYRYVAPHCLPDVVLGDFDSLPRGEVDGTVKVLSYPPEKDYTDGFLAVKIMIEQGFTHIDIYGAYGGRPDMAESNYALLALCKQKNVAACFCGDMHTYLVGEPFTATVKKGATFSVVPFTDSVHIQYTKGLKYALHDYTMYKLRDLDSHHYVMGVSNEGLGGEAQLAVDAGLALVYIEQ